MHCISRNAAKYASATLRAKTNPSGIVHRSNHIYQEISRAIFVCPRHSTSGNGARFGSVALHIKSSAHEIVHCPNQKYLDIWPLLNKKFVCPTRMEESSYLTYKICRLQYEMCAQGLVSFIHAMPAASKVLTTFRSVIYNEDLSCKENSLKKPNAFFKYLRDPQQAESFSELLPQIKMVAESKAKNQKPAFLSLSYSLTCGLYPLETAMGWGFANHFNEKSYFTMMEPFCDLLKKIDSHSSAYVYFRNTGGQLIRQYGRLRVGNFQIIGAPEETTSRFFYDSAPYNIPTGKNILSVFQNPSEHTKTLVENGAHIATMLFCKETLHPKSGIKIVTANEDDEVMSFCNDRFTNYFPKSDFEKEENDIRAALDKELERLVGEFRSFQQTRRGSFHFIDKEDILCSRNDYPSMPP